MMNLRILLACVVSLVAVVDQIQGWERVIVKAAARVQFREDLRAEWEACLDITAYVAAFKIPFLHK